jgi:hypothetical protein
MQSREMTFTQITRARYETRIYADSLDAGNGLEGLIAQMERSQAKRLAHELLPEATPSFSPPGKLPVRSSQVSDMLSAVRTLRPQPHIPVGSPPIERSGP